MKPLKIYHVKANRASGEQHDIFVLLEKEPSEDLLRRIIIQEGLEEEMEDLLKNYVAYPIEIYEQQD